MNVRPVLPLAVLALLAGACVPRTAQRPPAGSLELLAPQVFVSTAAAAGATVAVLPFRTPSGIVTGLGAHAGDTLLKEGARLRRIAAVDRKKLCAGLAEMELGLAGLNETAAAQRLGRVGASRWLLTGTIEPSGKDELLVTARLLDTATGRAKSSGRTTLRFTPELRAMYDRRLAADPCPRTGKPAAAKPPARAPAGWPAEPLSLTLPEKPAAALAAGKDGSLHLLVTTLAGGKPRLMHLKRTESAWSEPISVDDVAAVDVALAVAADGRAHALYTTTAAVRYLHIGGPESSPSELAPAGSAAAGGWVALALDGRSSPHAAIGGANGGLYYAGVHGARWAALKELEPASAGRVEPAIAAAGKGSVLIVYGAGGALKSAWYRQGSAWRGSEFQPAGARAASPDLSVNDDGNAVAAWFSHRDSAFFLSTRQGNDWTTPQRTPGGGGGRVALGRDAQGFLHAAVRLMPGHGVMHAVIGEGGLRTEPAAEEAGASLFRQSLAVDASDVVHVLWYNRGLKKLFLASKPRK